MPPRSKAQARFMRGVASGSIKAPGLSKAEANKYVSGYPTKSLPERVDKEDDDEMEDEDNEKEEKGEKPKKAPAGRRLQRGRQMRKGRRAVK